MRLVPFRRVDQPRAAAKLSSSWIQYSRSSAETKNMKRPTARSTRMR